MGKPSFLCFFSAIHFNTQKKVFLAFLIINILMHPADQAVVYGCHEENAYVMTNRLTISNTFPVMISAGTEQRQAIKEPIPMMMIPTRAASLYFPIIILRYVHQDRIEHAADDQTFKRGQSERDQVYAGKGDAPCQP